MPTSTKPLQCRHIFTDGHRCGSPALRHQAFCYYHHTTRRPASSTELAARHRRHTPFTLSLTEDRSDDRSAIQLSICDVLRRIAANQIDSRRAALLLYGLQTASTNLQRIAESPRDPEPVHEIVADPSLGTLAPVAELGSGTPQPFSLATYLMDELNLQRPPAVLDQQPADLP